jgi:hypothetical protein
MPRLVKSCKLKIIFNAYTFHLRHKRRQRQLEDGPMATWRPPQRGTVQRLGGIAHDTLQENDK